jgi:hypothetical protein
MNTPSFAIHLHIQLAWLPSFIIEKKLNVFQLQEFYLIIYDL